MLGSGKRTRFGKCGGKLIAVALCLLAPSAGPAAVTITAVPTAATSIVIDNPGFTNVLICDWNVDCAESGVAAVAWTVEPFVAHKQARNRFDARIRVAVLRSVGPVAVTITQPTAVTTPGGKATVSAVVSGTGTVRFRTWLSPADFSELQPEGLYTAVVYAASITP